MLMDKVVQKKGDMAASTININNPHDHHACTHQTRTDLSGAFIAGWLSLLFGLLGPLCGLTRVGSQLVCSGGQGCG